MSVERRHLHTALEHVCTACSDLYRESHAQTTNGRGLKVQCSAAAWQIVQVAALRTHDDTPHHLVFELVRAKSHL